MFLCAIIQVNKGKGKDGTVQWETKLGFERKRITVEKIIKTNAPHGIVKICFTPDEEIGRGADHFNVEAFGADWAYTVDGGELGELEFENFNAAKAVIEINGRMIHPGYAKDKMINALKLAMEISCWRLLSMKLMEMFS